MIVAVTIWLGSGILTALWLLLRLGPWTELCIALDADETEAEKRQVARTAVDLMQDFEANPEDVFALGALFGPIGLLSVFIAECMPIGIWLRGKIYKDGGH
jgi:hypothetical protein